MTLGELRLERNRYEKEEHENKVLSENATSERWKTIYLGRSLFAQYKKDLLQGQIEARERPKAISDAGVALIAGFEGGQSPDGLFRPYKDIAGVWTIGYGHTGTLDGKPIREHKPITKDAAMALLRRDLQIQYVPAVLALNVPLNQNQLDALVSFVFNVGIAALGTNYTIGRDLRAKLYGKVADDMLAWNKARVGGVLQPVAGLTRRRTVERSLFLR